MLDEESIRENNSKISSKKPYLRHQNILESKRPESFKTLSEIRVEMEFDRCCHDRLDSDTSVDNQRSKEKVKVRTRKKLVRQTRSVDDEFLDLKALSPLNDDQKSSSTKSLKMIQTLNRESNLDLYRSHPDKLNLKKNFTRGPQECNCRVLNHSKGFSTSSSNRLKDFEKMTIFEGKSLERKTENNCEFSSTESMVWLESELRMITPKLFCINNLKPLNGILCDSINKEVELPTLQICDISKLQTDKSKKYNQKEGTMKNTSSMSNSLCSREDQQTHLTENIFKSEWNHNFPSSCDLKAMIRDSTSVTADTNKSLVNVCHTNNSSEASLNSGTRTSGELSGESVASNKLVRQKCVRKQSSQMTVEADVHVTPKNNSFAPNEDGCCPDYNPLALLENDLSLYQDFGLPTHLASMEDIN